MKIAYIRFVESWFDKCKRSSSGDAKFQLVLEIVITFYDLYYNDPKNILFLILSTPAVKNIICKHESDISWM